MLIDQQIRAESVFRTIFLYPYAMSFIVTGLVWQWFLNPALGLQKLVRDLGFPGFTFDWIVNQRMVVYTLVIAGLWQASGLVMAILLAGLRGVDEDLWKAARVDGIPTWRVYLSIVLPLLGPMVVTATVLLAIAVVKVYDLVVAMTRGGPGIASEVPAKFVMDYLFERNNIGLATAAADDDAGDRGLPCSRPGSTAATSARSGGARDRDLPGAPSPPTARRRRRPKRLTAARRRRLRLPRHRPLFFLLPL